MLGQDIGKYRVTAAIGEGGMGAVYLAEHKLIGREAAIKVLLPQFSHNQEIVNRFFNEAKAASGVRHPGIVEIYDFGYHTDGSAYIVMEYLVGESLERCIRTLGRLPIDRALNITRQMMSALSAAHAQGIVHRDLKPDNVYLVGDHDMVGGERAKVLDFGIAKLSGEQAVSVKTRTGAVMGTPTYMAPEQCKGAGRVDHRADLYAVGCILFEMICGRPPFVAEGGGEVMAQHIYEPPPRPIGFEPTISEALEALMLRLLAKDPAERYQSADELSRALRQLPDGGVTWPTGHTDPSLTGPPLRHQTPPPVYPVPSDLASAQSAPPSTQTTLSHAAGVSGAYSSWTGAPARRSRGWLAVAAIAGVLVVGGITFAVVRGSGSDDSRSSAESSEAAERSVAGAAGTAAGTLEPAVDAPAANTGERKPPEAPERVVVSITSKPSGADVYLMPSQTRLGTTPFHDTLPVAIGERVFVLKLRGYDDQTIAMPADALGKREAVLVRADSGSNKASDKHTAKHTTSSKPVPDDSKHDKDTKPADPPKDKDTSVKVKPGGLDPFDKKSGGDSPSLDPFNK